MRPTPVDTSFEELIKAFLAAHTSVTCEWRDVKELLSSRTDLVCGVGLPTEVFASFNRGGQITVGVTNEGNHEDFEDFGRGLTDQQVAREAFDHFVTLLREKGHLVDGVNT